MSLPINHLISKLQRCCGKFEFVQHDQSDGFCPPWAATVRFLNTGLVYQCLLHFDGNWTAVDDSTVATCPRLTGILNGHTRSESGEVAPVYETPDKVVL